MRASILRCRLAVLAAALLAAACDDGPLLSRRFADISTDAARYTPGATVEVTIRNVFFRPIGAETCPWYLQRSAGDGWVTVATEDMCLLASWMPLEPGEIRRTFVAIPDNAPQGIYRIWFPSIRPMTDDPIPSELQSTAQFEVAALQPG